MKALLLAAAAAMALGASAAAAPLAGFPAVEDTSFVEANGDRAIQLSVDVPAPAAEVWRAWTTAEGWQRFATPLAWVDLRIGGMIETSYSPEAARGAPGNIQNQILAYVPERLLVIRNVKAPPGFQHAEEFARTATVIELQPVGPRVTRVTLSGVGFGAGPAYDSLYAMFMKGDAWTLEQLRKSFAEGPVDWAKVLAAPPKAPNDVKGDK